MTIASFVNEIATHQFADLLHFRITQPGNVPNSLAVSILESDAALNRPLTSEELTWLGDIISGITLGDFTDRDFEAAARLFESDWITEAQFLAVLGL